MRITDLRGSVEYELEGITVFAPNTGKTDVPQQAVMPFRKHSMH